MFLKARRRGEEWSSSKVSENEEESKGVHERYSFKRCKWPFKKKWWRRDLFLEKGF